MDRTTCRRAIIYFAIASAMALSALSQIAFGSDSPATSDTVSRQRVVAKLIAKWDGIFGPIGCSGENDVLFQHLVDVHPQALASFTTFTDEVVSTQGTDRYYSWLPVFFKNGFLDAVRTQKPLGYYMNDGRTEASLLLFRLTYDNCDVLIMDNYKVLFMIVSPGDYAHQKGITGDAVANILKEWTNLSENGVFPDGVSFPAVMRIGNRIAASKGNAFIEFKWQKQFFGFVANNGICLKFVKTQEGSQPIQRMEIPRDFNWYNKQLYRKDGRTLISPPTNERLNDPFHISPTGQEPPIRKRWSKS